VAAMEAESQHEDATYNTLVKSILLYDADTWIMFKSDEQKLEVFQTSFNAAFLGYAGMISSPIRGLRNSAIRSGIGISKTEPYRTELFIEFRKSRNFGICFAKLIIKRLQTTGEKIENCKLTVDQCVYC